MMREEFIQRTGYTPEIRRADDGWTVEYDEYEYIEQSYYDSDCVNKDEFCKEWLKSYKAGFWKRELQLLRQMKDKDETIKRSDARIKDFNESLSDEINKRLVLKRKLEDAERKLNRITAIVTGECQIAK